MENMNSHGRDKASKNKHSPSATAKCFSEERGIVTWNINHFTAGQSTYLTHKSAGQKERHHCDGKGGCSRHIDVARTVPGVTLSMTALTADAAIQSEARKTKSAS
jgi:hypothetical protein